jgi:23S rRNA pseudouridine1911/1915/1917 synthase
MKLLFEDKDILVFEKPYGLVMHEGDKEDDMETFLSLLLRSYPEQSLIENPYRLQKKTINLSGIVHRLDRDTSGIIVVARNETTLSALKNAFKENKIKKEYTALVHGNISKNITIDISLGREKKGFKRVPECNLNARGPFLEAKTEVRPLEVMGDRSKVLLLPLTGRTHQLRAHLSFIHHPIVGDILYGLTSDKQEKRLYLHASKITLPDGRSFNSHPLF